MMPGLMLLSFMIQLLIFAVALAQSATSGTPRIKCPQLATGQTLSLIVSRNHPACVLVSVAPGEATWVVVNHREDLALHLTGGGKEITSDGFEFGQETLTIDSPGHYRIDIIIAGKPSGSTQLTIPMSRKALPLESAAGWQSAERSATDSKLSGKLAEISASLELWKVLGDLSSIARTWLKIGDAALRSDLKRAQDAYEHAFEICQSIGDIRCSAEAANNSGLVARQLGDFNGSFARLQYAADGWKTLPSPANQGRTLSNLGILFSRVGDFQQAISNYDHAKSLLREREPLAYARVLNNLGLCYLSLADYEKATILFQNAIAAEIKLQGTKVDIMLARVNLGRTYMLQGKLRLARTTIEPIVAQAAKQPDRRTRAFALNNLGQVFLRLGQMDLAEAHMKDALALHRTLGDKRGEAIALHYLGIVAHKHGDIGLARHLLNQALQIRRDCGMRDDAADSLFELARLEFETGDPVRARSLAEEAISQLESVRTHVPGAPLRASFYARRRSLLDLLVVIAMRSDNKDAAVEGLLAAEFGRGRSLLDLLAERGLSSSRPPELADRQRRIRREIDLLSLRASTEPQEYEGIRRQIETLIAENDEVEALIRGSIEEREPGARPLSSVSSLQRDYLSPQSAILEYHLGEDASHAWLIRDQKIEVFRLPPRHVIEREISAALSFFGQLLERRRDPGKQAAFEKGMRRLSSTLLGPLRDTDLPALVILILDGDLHRVPFAALRLPKGDYLGAHHDLVRAPSAAFLMQATQPRASFNFPKSVLAIYDPVFSTNDPRVPSAARKRTDIARAPNFARLPFNEELRTISHFVPASRYDFLGGFDANVKALQLQQLDRYGILHFSTHAVINDGIPELSHLVLSMTDRRGRPLNGFLLPYQLAELRLSGSVVVLSACDTALGKKVLGEGMIGFSSSLFSAGASQLVLTLSAVDAEASSIFLSDTYRHMLSRQHSNTEHALTLARQSFLKSDRWSDPYYWASFVVVGMPTLSYRLKEYGAE